MHDFRELTRSRFRTDGSLAKGSMIRTVGSDLMLFSHAGNVDGTGSRWNMTIWAFRNSAESWTPAVQVEPDADILLHLAYSCLLQLSRWHRRLVAFQDLNLA